MNEQPAQSKKITIGLILNWIFGVLFALAGIVTVFTKPIPGLVMLVLAAVLLPPVIKLIDQKLKFHLSGGVKIAIVIIGLIIVGTTAGTSGTANTNQANVNNEESQATNNETATNTTTPTNQVNATQPPTNTNQPKNSNTGIAPTTANTNKSSAPTNTNSEPAPTSSETTSQKNAAEQAKSYLSTAAFSHDGLVAQLEYGKFSHADAVYGADNSGGDWNVQAITDIHLTP